MFRLKNKEIKPKKDPNKKPIFQIFLGIQGRVRILLTMIARTNPIMADDVSNPLTICLDIFVFSIANIAAALYSPPAEIPCKIREEIIRTVAKIPTSEKVGETVGIRDAQDIRKTDNFKESVREILSPMYPNNKLPRGLKTRDRQNVIMVEDVESVSGKNSFCMRIDSDANNV